jgi:hypothetical protein
MSGGCLSVLNRGWREEGEGNSRKLPMEWKATSIGERIHGSFEFSDVNASGHSSD